MEEPSPHEHPVAPRHVNPPELGKPSGFSHAVSGVGRQVFLAGQTALNPEGIIVGDTVVEQFETALSSLLAALRAAGGGPEHLASLTIYIVDMEDYKAHAREIGRVWKRLIGAELSGAGRDRCRPPLGQGGARRGAGAGRPARLSQGLAIDRLRRGRTGGPIRLGRTRTPTDGLRCGPARRSGAPGPLADGAAQRRCPLPARPSTRAAAAPAGARGRGKAAGAMW